MDQSGRDTQQVVLQESPVGGRRAGKTPRRGKVISDAENSTGKCMQTGKCMLSLPKLLAKFQRGKCMKNTQGKSSWGSMGVSVCRRKMGNREVKKSRSCCLLNDANSASFSFTSAFIKMNQINTASCINSIWGYLKFNPLSSKKEFVRSLKKHYQISHCRPGSTGEANRPADSNLVNHVWIPALILDRVPLSLQLPP